MHTSDGVNKVWTVRYFAGLEVSGHKSEGDAALSLLRVESYKEEYLAKLLEHRAQVTRLIRNERRQRKAAR